MTDEEGSTFANDLQEEAKKRGLVFAIVFAGPPNSQERPTFHLVAEDTTLLYEPKHIGSTYETALAYISERAARAAFIARELARPYYGG